MPTKHPRLNVVIPKVILKALTEISKQQDKSLSVVAQELIVEALELHEDILLSNLAMKRDARTQRTVSHDKAWK